MRVVFTPRIARMYADHILALRLGSHQRSHHARSSLGPGDALRFQDDLSVFFDPLMRRKSGSFGLAEHIKTSSDLSAPLQQRSTSMDRLDPRCSSVNLAGSLMNLDPFKLDTKEAQARLPRCASIKEALDNDSSFANTSIATESSGLMRDFSHDSTAFTDATSDISQDGIELESAPFQHARTDSGTFSGGFKAKGSAGSSAAHFLVLPPKNASMPAAIPTGPLSPGTATPPATATRSRFHEMRHDAEAFLPSPLLATTDRLPGTPPPFDEQIKLDEADPKVVAAALHYHRTSPTQAAANDKDKIACELCGALVIRWATLLPCNHRACSACCCSGVNQVSTTPPRRHVCAACQVPVNGLTLSSTAAETARAAAWRDVPDCEPLVGNDGRQNTPAAHHGELAGRFPGVTEALLGLDRPVRGRSASVVAAAFSMRPDPDSFSAPSSPLMSSLPHSEGNGVDDTAGHPDSSMTFSDDASFYLPSGARVKSRQRTSDGGLPVGPLDQEVLGDPQPQPHVAKRQKTDTVQQPTIPLSYEPGGVVRIDNIPWTTSYQDIVKWCPEPYSLLPDHATVPQPVHIPVDLKTGKTANCAFVELRDADCAKKLIRRRNNTKLRGRPVSLQLSNYDEVRSELFPSLQQLVPGTPAGSVVFLTPWQLEQMARLMQSGGPQLKSPLKPIELLASWVQLVPRELSAVQRDGLFERAIEVLARGTEWLNSSIDGLYFALHRLVHACINCPAFSPAQAARVLDHIRCIPSLKINKDVLARLSAAESGRMPSRPTQPALQSSAFAQSTGAERQSPLLPLRPQQAPFPSATSLGLNGFSTWPLMMDPPLAAPRVGVYQSASQAMMPLDFPTQRGGHPLASPAMRAMSGGPSLFHPWGPPTHDGSVSFEPGPYTGSLPHDLLSRPAASGLPEFRYP